MRHDRARIQIGRISPFGLLELSRQRLRPSLLEASTQPCPHCNGTGHIRSTESTALHLLRAIEEEGMRRRTAEIKVAVPSAVALYVLNQKRATLQQIEGRYGCHVTVDEDETLIPPAFRLERARAFTPAELAALAGAASGARPGRGRARGRRKPRRSRDRSGGRGILRQSATQRWRASRSRFLAAAKRRRGRSRNASRPAAKIMPARRATTGRRPESPPATASSAWSWQWP